MSTREHDYAIGTDGTEDFLFRRLNGIVEVRVNRSVKQPEVFDPTTMMIDLKGMNVSDYLAEVSRLSADLVESTVAVYTPSPWDYEDGRNGYDEDADASPRLIITGWTATLTPQQSEALGNTEFF